MELQMILFPSSYTGITKVDEDLRTEYDAVVNTGLYEICFFGYDKWFNQGQLVLSHRPEKPTVAVYRGWMMKPEPPGELLAKYQSLPGLFYTIDYAELEDGSWKIIEAGDGQVSGLSEGQDYEAFFRALHQCLKFDCP